MEDQIIFLASMGIFFIITLVNRSLSEKALAKLSNEEKGYLLTAFAQTRKNSLYILVGIIALYLGFSMADNHYQWLNDYKISMIIYFVLLLGYMIATQVASQRVLKRLDVPEEYKKAQIKIAFLRSLSIAVLTVGVYTIFR
ncbi:MAG: hypothetical protein ACON5K_08520 [Bacteroidia bacterium]